jgi:hypothetical protein
MAVVLVSLFIGPALSGADENSHRKAALNLIEVANVEKLLDQVIVSVEAMMRQQFNGMDLPPEGQAAAEKLQKEIIVWMSEIFQWEQMKNLYVDLYADVFSEQELNELIEFYQSPLGRKLLAKMPELMQKSMMKTQAVIQEKMPEFQRRMEASIAELEKKYKK